MRIRIFVGNFLEKLFVKKFRCGGFVDSVRLEKI
jgi:hypothetical protein